MIHNYFYNEQSFLQHQESLLWCFENVIVIQKYTQHYWFYIPELQL